ncbi:hypothetical protein H9Y04_02355 [Streptomyces sp. TRM66268-LWL]|uniref:Hydrogenase expression protein HypF n=1 Tax=Streptomyces polyasparticus TaxID=2767826 RepID=A0ABR7SAS1_9ACTN|nr:hypothetical protein [Streptomyces polyasparticus]MBC9711413.1 hypothetical protein [Streptomyces polyasparticus]
MPADETRLAERAESAPVRKGPRHAAPRKTLLTKLQIPANRALALAAMPTAVFVGMSLVPKPAMADDGEIPFSSGPCVTREDVEAAQEESASPTPSPSASETGAEAEKPEEKPSEEPTPTPSPSASETGADDAADATPQKAADEPAAEPTPSPSESKNPLDPLGVGDKLEEFGEDVKDFFTPGDEETATPSPTPSASEPAEEKPAAEETEEPAAEKPAAEKPADDPVKDAADKVTEGTQDAADKLKADMEKAADKVGAEVEDLDVPSLDEALKDLPLGKDGKPRFPCAEEDPKALAAADLEPGIPALPDYPWILKTSLLTLRGLDYHGVVNVKTASGAVKPVLKFTADNGVDIKDLHQLVTPPGGPTSHIEAAKGSTSTMSDGTVTMYTEKLEGNLFGLIPIEFTPETPPPLNVPFAFFTNVTVTQAGQFGGTLTVPGLKSYITK